MPTEVIKTFYSCDKCKHEYTNWSEAQNCEGVPLLEETHGLKEFNIGDEIHFNNEYQGGTRWVYQSGEGKIVEKKLIRHLNHHQYLYWTDGGEGVLWIQDEFGWKTFSPNELKRR